MATGDRRGARRLPGWPLVAAAALILVYLSASIFSPGINRPAPEMTATSTASPAAAASATAAVASSKPSLQPPFVKSWQGTDVAGDIHLNTAGNVIPDEDLHELFDYLLTASNVLTHQQIRQRLSDVGRDHRLDENRLAQLNELFARYNSYLAAAAAIHVDAGDPAGFRRSFEERRALRERMLGSEMADGFFARSEAQDRYQLAMLDVVNDKTLSDHQRQEKIAAVRSEAPPEVRAAQEPSEALKNLSARTEQLRQSGASAAEIEALRMQTVGPEAAARMQVLDQENDAWNQRMQALRTARQQILADAGIAEADKQHAIDDYIDKNFNGPDAVRARALLSLNQASIN